MIRTATLDDIYDIQALIIPLLKHFLIWPENVQSLPQWFLQKYRVDFIRKQIQDANSIALVYCDGNRIVGFGAMKKSSILNYLFVHSDYQCRGIGTALWEGLQSYSQHPCFALIPSSSIPFFYKLGFRGTNDMEYRDNVRYLLMIHENKCNVTHNSYNLSQR